MAGLVIVALAVGLGGWAVDRAGGGDLLLTARTDLVPGQRIDADDLVGVRVSWDGPPGTYLTEGALVPDAVVTSFVGAGELVPLSAIGSSPDVTGRPMTVPLPTGSQAKAGSLVDLWIVTEPTATAPGDAQLLVAEVLVTSVEEDSGAFRTGSGMVARVLVPPDAVAQVLEAAAAGDAVTVVERPGG